MSFPQPFQPTDLPLPDPEAYEGEPREYARALMQRKDEIEKEIEALRDVLASHQVGPETSLLDPEGYPRGDLDIYAIRHARAALVRLVNDRTTVSDLLPVALQAAFSAPATSGTPGPSARPANGVAANTTPNGNREEWPDRPVARVDIVAANSPAEAAGLQAGDLIHSFAGVTASSSGGLQAIGAAVSRSEGSSLNLLVVRAGERIQLQLTPRNGWGGRGSLGCHILPA
ncbi:putative 26S proteasome regulatory subunit [Cryptotrichosporon argae]